MDNESLSMFHPAYLKTNEDIRTIVAATPGARDVLTVAASGDNAMFYAAAGATCIDTYDMTMNARLIQALKHTAIQNIEHDKYHEFVNSIAKIKRHGINVIQESVRSKMRNEDLNLVPNFSTIGNIILDSDVKHMPTAAEYAQIKANMTQPVNFIWSNLRDLHTRLKRQYDVINISNIFDNGYISNPMEQMQILVNLTPFLRVGSSIVYNPQRTTGSEFANVRTPHLTTKIINMRDAKTRATRNIVLFQRVR
ncbi:DUF3419 family protein [bacterium]|nr:DUF3419 family protein [bacterium]